MNLRLTFVAAAVSLLAGCSSLGTKELPCPSQTTGTTCMSAREVYNATHVADRVEPNYRDGKPIDSKGGEPSAAGSGGSSGNAAAPAAALTRAASYHPPLPDVNTPLPVRMPPKVMRVRFFPWETPNGDLVAGDVVFTEVAGRSWTLGEEQVARVQSNTINPLEVPRNYSSSGTPSGSAFQSPLGTPPAAATNGQAPARALNPLTGR